VRKPRLRHPGLSLVRRGAGSAVPSSALRHGRLLRIWSPLALPMHFDLASASVQGVLTLRAFRGRVK